MGLIEVKKNFTRTELLCFGPLMALFVGVIGGIAIHRHEARTFAYGLWGAAGILILLYYLIPSIRVPVYRGWIYAVMPIGWIVSHVLLTLIYYALLTPIGLMMRAVGYDPMQRQLDPEATTYWIRREPPRPKASYFKQF